MILNNIFPVEYIYGDWFQWMAQNEANHAILMKEGCESENSLIETGSRVEGFCIPKCLVSGIDTSSLGDIGYWEPDTHIMVSNDSYIEMDGQSIPIFTVDHCKEDPRYVKLVLTKEWKECFPRYATQTLLDHSYLLSDDRPAELINKPENPKRKWRYGIYGSVHKAREDTAIFTGDSTAVFKYPRSWPEPAMNWVTRERSGTWPKCELIQEVLESGCHITPVTTRKQRQGTVTDDDVFTFDMDQTEWRLSFSMAENKLAQSVTPVQRHIMVLLKMLKKRYFPELISSYHLKNLLFWEIEKSDESFWKEDYSAKCLIHMLDRLEQCLVEGRLPHYIIQESNLLENEEPSRLQEAGKTVADVRRNIVEHCICLFRRIVVISFESFQTDIELESFIAKLQDRDQTYETNQQILHMLLRLFIKKYEECLGTLRVIQNDKSIEIEMKIRMAIYESLLARSLTKLRVCDRNTNDFQVSVKKEMLGDCSDEFLGALFMFFEHAQKGKDLSLLVPNFMEVTKVLHNRIIQESFEENESPLKELVSIVQSGDYFQISDLLADLGMPANDTELVTKL